MTRRNALAWTIFFLLGIGIIGAGGCVGRPTSGSVAPTLVASVDPAPLAVEAKAAPPELQPTSVTQPSVADSTPSPVAVTATTAATLSPIALPTAEATSRGGATKDVEVPATATTAAPLPAAAQIPTAIPTVATGAILPTAVPSPASRQLNIPAAPPLARGGEQGAGNNTRLWRGRGMELADGELVGVVAAQNEIQLSAEAGQHAPLGTLTSSVHEAAFPFNNAVLSWNAAAPAATRLRFELRVRSGNAVTGSWSPWYVMGSWSVAGGASSKGQSDEWAQVDTDTLALRRLAQAWQYRVVFSSDGSATPSLTALGLVYADLRSPLSGPPVAASGEWARELPVPAYSQLEQEASIARVICSPTSLTMLINYYGGKKSVAEVAKGVRDGDNGIFGNWPLNTAYAATLGFDAYVNRLYSMDQVANLTAAGKPVAASIRYGPGQLPGAPLYETSGHLIVIRGFTREGNVIVNDPFVPSASQARHVLRRADLENVWLTSGGIVYVLDKLAS